MAQPLFPHSSISYSPDCIHRGLDTVLVVRRGITVGTSVGTTGSPNTSHTFSSPSLFACPSKGSPTASMVSCHSVSSPTTVSPRAAEEASSVLGTEASYCSCSAAMFRNEECQSQDQGPRLPLGQLHLYHVFY